MAKQYIEIYSGGTVTDTVESLSEYAVTSGVTLIAYADGTVTASTVKSGGTLEVTGGTVTSTAVRSGGVMTVHSGTVSGITLRAGATLNLNGDASDITLANGGTINVNSGGVAEDVLLNVEGCVATVQSGGRLVGSTCDGGEVTVKSGAVVTDTVVKGYQAVGLETKTVIGKLTLESGAVHRGTLTITSHGSVIAEAGSTIDFTVSGRAPGGSALISDFSRITGTPTYTLTVDGSQATGVYALADKVSAFDEAVSVRDAQDAVLGTLSTATALETPDYSYALSLADQTLCLTVGDSPQKPHDLSGDAVGVAWASTADDFIVQYSKDDFGSVLEVNTDACGLDTYALSAGSYDWQVRNTAGSRWTEGDDIVSSGTTGDATAWQSDGDGTSDLFFGNASGTWTNEYLAQHVGSVGDWSGTNEWIYLTGKNKISDTFTGSADASVLVLTDDAQGDALFVDDVYTAFPADPQSRIAQIDEIRAGAGDDVVDMTSQTFEYVGGGVTVRGGSGNDTLWANKGANRLFGDADNDRLVGASGNDILVGGSGDDSLHGGGGDDVFCFCDDWGSDSVEQLSDGGVTLWFASGSEANWDPTTRTYTDGDNTVSVAGDAAVTLKFGDDGSARYDELVAAGCFQGATSERIFETAQEGILASA